MCEPTTVTMTYLAIASGAVSAASQIQQGNEANAVAKYNAREQENQATRVRNKGTEEENIKRRETAEFLSKQRAMLGASGIDLGSGSAADLQQDTELLGEVDALRIRSNFDDQATQMERQAELTRQQGRSAKRAGQISALGTALSTAATVGMINATPVGAGELGKNGAASIGGKGGFSGKWYTPDSSANVFAIS